MKQRLYHKCIRLKVIADTFESRIQILFKFYIPIPVSTPTSKGALTQPQE